MRALHYAIALCGLVVLLHGGVLAQEASRDNFLVEQGVARRPESYAAGTVVLSNRFGRVEISRYAAQVLSYVPAGGREVFYMPDDRDFSRTREMHGGVPLRPRISIHWRLSFHGTAPSSASPTQSASILKNAPS